MTNEQIQYLKDNDIPYSPLLFKYCKYSFPRYLGHMRLTAYRGFGWKDSDFIEEGAREWVERLYKDD